MSNEINFKGAGNEMSRGKGLDDGSNDDTEGHVSAQQQPGKPRVRWGLDDGSGDDAEGHAARKGF
jgi:hypothetical protein